MTGPNSDQAGEWAVNDELTYRAVLNAAPVGIAITTKDGRFRRVNQRLCQMLGYSADELRERTFEDVTHPDDLDTSLALQKEAYEDVFEGGRLEKRYLHRSGAVVWAEIEVRRVDRSGGEPFLVVAIDDVTDRKRREEMATVFATQSRRLSSIISRSPFFTALTGADGRVSYINEAGLKLLGIDEIVFAELGGMDVAEIAPAASGGGPLIEAVRRRGSWLGECNFRESVSGQETPMEACAFETAETLEAGEGGTAIVAYDITRRREFQVQVESKNRRLALLARRLLAAQEKERAAIARELHDDVTQDLSFLAMELGILQGEEEVTPPIATKLAAAYEKIGDLAEKVRKLSHQYHPSVLHHSDLNGALRSLCAELSEMNGVKIDFETEGDVSACPRGTATVIYRIVQEALRNALKHADAARLAVSVAASDGGLRVLVADDGRGFDPEEAEEGAGLGLQSMSERAETVGAKVSVKSAPGEGARIEVVASIAAAADRDLDSPSSF